MKKIIENERLYLRELSEDDLEDLCAILQDEETMYAYEAPFTDEKVTDWLNWNLASYQKNQFGLWAIVDKNEENFVGQCGIVYSEVEGKNLLEIGYLLNKRYWHKGYASEASALCLNYAKNILQAQKICSIIRDTNSASQKVAENNGMTIVQEFYKDYSGLPVKHYVYSIDLVK
ncbi:MULTISPECIES: GNAT family N-acetyltransferase [unclassified Enterococcus]|uniref:GNAT family N-acetyltransferase n=1 Tax=unclassified Enterococcus TaxID=2608891 RepID=UPI001CE108A2|nr:MULTISPECIES: GNAT family N-acetyltransferase [unclassified Enterococcus]MCA5012404.1 GNAT family N-acetyltransferase [Enterococcus sp. S23]MCA5015655.1 GNAT family N-acetyltransferase [Enterococcus sp. S22(2020)]